MKASPKCLKNGPTPVKAACGITGVKWAFLIKKAPTIMKTSNVIILAAAEMLLTIFTQDLPKKLIIENSKIKKITPLM